MGRHNGPSGLREDDDDDVKMWQNLEYSKRGAVKNGKRSHTRYMSIGPGWRWFLCLGSQPTSEIVINVITAITLHQACGYLLSHKAVKAPPPFGQYQIANSLSRVLRWSAMGKSWTNKLTTSRLLLWCHNYYISPPYFALCHFLTLFDTCLVCHILTVAVMISESRETLFYFMEWVVF